MKVAELIASLGLEVDKGSFDAGAKAIDGIKHALQALAVFQGVRMLKDMIEHVSEAADKAVKMGQKLGVSAESIQELGYAASLSDVPLEGLVGSMQKLERRLDAVAQKGKGPAADALRRLGISAKELTNLSVDQKLERIADGFADLPASVSKVPLAVQLGLGPNLIPLLKEGGDGIREMREEARMLGLVVDTETAEAFEAWNDDLTRVKGAVQGLKNDAVIALVPMLREMTTAVFGWVRANRELIKTRLEEVMRAVLTVAKALARAIGIVYEIFEKIAPILGEVVNAFGNLVSAGGNLEDNLVYAALAIAGAWALTELPFILLTAGIAALVLIVQDLWSGINGGDSVIGELLIAIEEALGETGAGRVVLGLKASFMAMFDFVVAKFEWLMEQGRKLGKMAYELIHGDTQFQADEDAANGNRFEAAARGQLRAAYGTPGTNTGSGIDRVVQAPARTGPDTGYKPRTGMTGIDQVVRAPPSGLAQPSYLTLPTFATPAVNVAAPQMHLNVTVQGNADASTVASVETIIRAFWNDAMRDTTIAAGVRKGTLP